MKNPICIMHVAPWDWPLAEWSIQSWLKVCSKVYCCYEQNGHGELIDWSGKAYKDPYWSGPDTYVTEVFGKEVELVNFPASAIPQTQPFAIEAAVRNMSTFLADCDQPWIMPDADEYCLHPEETREVLTYPMSPIATIRAPIIDVCGCTAANEWIVADGLSTFYKASERGTWNLARSTELRAPVYHIPPTLHFRHLATKKQTRKAYLGENHQTELENCMFNGAPLSTLKHDLSQFTGFRELTTIGLGAPLPNHHLLPEPKGSLHGTWTRQDDTAKD